MKLSDLVKFAVLLFTTILARLLQFFPNLEPIMPTMLPTAKRYGALAGFVFSFTAIASISFITGTIGWFTLYTALAYALVGFFAGLYFKRFKRVGAKHYAGFAVAGILFYDIVTAGLFGVEFGQDLVLTYFAQIPFTAFHLLTVIPVVLLSPLIEKHFLENKELDYAFEKFFRFTLLKHEEPAPSPVKRFELD